MQAAPGSAVNSSLLSLYASPGFGRTLSLEGCALADASAAEGSAGAPSSPEMSQTFTANPLADLEPQELKGAGLEASSEPQQTGEAGSILRQSVPVKTPTSSSLGLHEYHAGCVAEHLLPHKPGPACRNRCTEHPFVLL